MKVRFQKEQLKTFPTLLLAGFLLWPLAGFADDIQISELPKEVTDTINSQYPGATYLKAERDTDDGRIEYEVNICHEGTEWEIELYPDGTVKDIDNEGRC